MKKISRFFAVLSIAASATTHAQEKDYCKADCASDKKECRHTADGKIKSHGDAPLISSDTKPRVPGPDMDAYLENQHALSDERQKMRGDLHLKPLRPAFDAILSQE